MVSLKQTNMYKKRHETPVLDHPIKIIFVDNDLVVLDKPCSLPVSSCKKNFEKSIENGDFFVFVVSSK